jgi:CubicO group peptidase (beta-lactamase class C family)
MDAALLKKELASWAGFRVSGGYFPGCVIGVVWRNGDRIIVPAGKFTYEPDSRFVTADSIYDMSSVTKSIPTACLLLKLIDDGLIGMDEPVVSYVPELAIHGRESLLIRHLLRFILNYKNPEDSLEGIKYRSTDELLNFLFSSENKQSSDVSYFYTNAMAILMGLVIERAAGAPLDVLAKRTFFHPLGMERTGFWPEKLPCEKIVPTEIDTWRGREICAVVRDETAQASRQAKKPCVESAGLFSSAEDMLIFLEMLLAGGVLNGRRYFLDATVKKMHTNQLSEIGACQGLGWKMNRPWMGAHHGPNAFGMTGFTGTAVFCDPDRDVGVVILSNGIYSSHEKENNEDLRDKFRAEILDIILKKQS